MKSQTVQKSIREILEDGVRRDAIAHDWHMSDYHPYVRYGDEIWMHYTKLLKKISKVEDVAGMESFKNFKENCKMAVKHLNEEDGEKISQSFKLITEITGREPIGVHKWDTNRMHLFVRMD